MRIEQPLRVLLIPAALWPMRGHRHHPQKFHSVGRNNALQRGPVRNRSKLPRRTALNAVVRGRTAARAKTGKPGKCPSFPRFPPTTAPWGHG
jgi:hypothetical protein